LQLPRTDYYHPAILPVENPDQMPPWSLHVLLATMFLLQ